jgi:hypothetical protein
MIPNLRLNGWREEKDTESQPIFPRTSQVYQSAERRVKEKLHI